MYEFCDNNGSKDRRIESVCYITYYKSKPGRISGKMVREYFSDEIFAEKKIHELMHKEACILPELVRL